MKKCKKYDCYWILKHFFLKIFVFPTKKKNTNDDELTFKKVANIYIWFKNGKMCFLQLN